MFFLVFVLSSLRHLQNVASQSSFATRKIYLNKHASIITSSIYGDTILFFYGTLFADIRSWSMIHGSCCTSTPIYSTPLPAVHPRPMITPWYERNHSCVQSVGKIPQQGRSHLWILTNTSQHATCLVEPSLLPLRPFAVRTQYYRSLWCVTAAAAVYTCMYAHHMYTRVYLYYYWHVKKRKVVLSFKLRYRCTIIKFNCTYCYDIRSTTAACCSCRRVEEIHNNKPRSYCCCSLYRETCKSIRLYLCRGQQYT